MTSKRTRSAISSQAPAYGQMPLDLQGGRIAESSGPGAALASHFQQLDGVKEPMIQGTCGRTYFNSSVQLDRVTSLESRLVVQLGMVGSTESSMILRQNTTPAGRRILRLAPSTRHINAPGCGGGERWQTPTTTDAKGRGYQTAGAKVYPSLLGQMDPSKLRKYWLTPTANPDNKAQAKWSTPRATDGEKGGPNQSFWAGGQPLPAQIPSTRDYKDSAGMALERTDGTPRTDRQSRQMIAQERIGETTGSNATTAKRGAPNPAFAFWLMGFPDALISGVLRAMQSYRKSPQR